MTVIRCVVESMNYSACGMRAGDYVEFDGSRMTIPGERGFCQFALAAAANAVLAHGIDTKWLDSRPLVACPDPPEGIRMRIERVDEEAGR